MNLLLNKIKEAYKNKVPFVAYNKPNDATIFGIFQKEATLHKIASDFTQAGFVFAPFNASEKTIFFPLDASEFISDSFTKEQLHFKEKSYFNNASKATHINIVQKALDAINKNDFKKVVISRKEIVALNGVEVEEIYSNLLQLYPNAFVYVWFHPQVGLWFGATPETLLEVEKNSFKTMSLAGTQVYKKGEKVSWNPKEIEEQQIVTDYILNKLSSFSTNLKQLKTETVKAGSLLHLRTEIKGDLTKEGLFSLVNLLHPTPAVCGLPKEKAKQFILENENYNRSYYTGFLGELNINTNKNSHLFVNLRCMEIINNNAEIYVGGGITKESNPEKEWEETVAKSNIMLKAL
ncbi:Salicylate biosynthesis isochorismate synthase [Polaribacter huanghezhanensis]|uniref:chorismate-binding protein n=1 Tax=Polaribacter huanghezhanensis TaxID=1354726 RepID=UPI0026495F49|nr:chorismate-binding protein [Polaribacter huanghezhanensis]WKD86874.1 Salicylate biosynthesis isochorismate synthase [Polaribacter huanghezhanensis]